MTIHRLPPGIWRSTATLYLRDQRSVIVSGSGDHETLPATLTGQEPGTILAWEGPAGEPWLVLENCENITLRDLSLHGGGIAIYCGGGPIDTSSIRLENVSFSHCPVGLRLSRPGDPSVDTSRIVDCTFRSCETGILFDSNQAVGWSLSSCRFVVPANGRGIWCRSGGGFRLECGSFSGGAGAVGVDLQYITDAITLDHCTFECGAGMLAIRENMYRTDPPQKARIVGGRIDAPPGQQTIMTTGYTEITWDGVRWVGGIAP